MFTAKLVDKEKTHSGMFRRAALPIPVDEFGVKSREKYNSASSVSNKAKTKFAKKAKLYQSLGYEVSMNLLLVNTTLFKPSLIYYIYLWGLGYCCYIVNHGARTSDQQYSRR